MLLTAADAAAADADAVGRFVFAHLGLAQNVVLTRCHCDDVIKEMRKALMKKPEVKVGLGPRPKIVGMGLKKIRALAKDPFAFMWNVRKILDKQRNDFK